VISVCYLSILFTELPEIYQNKSENPLTYPENRV